MELETMPPQPDPVNEAIRAALGDPAPAADPWWQAGLDETLAPAE